MATKHCTQTKKKRKLLLLTQLFGLKTSSKMFCLVHNPKTEAGIREFLLKMTQNVFSGSSVSQSRTPEPRRVMTKTRATPAQRDTE